jgi:peptidoglycan/LPS O-acetylase OafA/YrhL
MKTRNLMVAALAVAALATTAIPTHAATDMDLRFGVYTDADAFALGGGLLTPLGSNRGWFFNPNIEVALPGDGSVLTLNADLHYDFPTDGGVSPYLGAGPAVVRVSPDGGDADTELGLNLFAGIAGKQGTVRPFAQIKGMFAGGSDVALMGGIRF